MFLFIESPRHTIKTCLYHLLVFSQKPKTSPSFYPLPYLLSQSRVSSQKHLGFSFSTVIREPTGTPLKLQKWTLWTKNGLIGPCHFLLGHIIRGSVHEHQVPFLITAHCFKPHSDLKLEMHQTDSCEVHLSIRVNVSVLQIFSLLSLCLFFF